MSANDKQVGGSHYQKGAVQHWDLAIEHDIPYTLGCATKYLFRWKDKNGIQDLEKAMHYLQKTRECASTISKRWTEGAGAAVPIPDYVGADERDICRAALEWDLDSAIDLLSDLIRAAKDDARSDDPYIPRD
ncbi:hypothetical protein [Caudoviricetes sp.]|nr:hypothetical protein [Caudoviricetes sp.]